MSEPILLDAFVAGATVPCGHREILREILISLSPDSVPMEAFRRNLDWPDAAGFVALDDSFYDPPQGHGDQDGKIGAEGKRAL